MKPTTGSLKATVTGIGERLVTAGADEQSVAAGATMSEVRGSIAEGRLRLPDRSWTLPASRWTITGPWPDGVTSTRYVLGLPSTGVAAPAVPPVTARAEPSKSATGSLKITVTGIGDTLVESQDVVESSATVGG